MVRAGCKATIAANYSGQRLVDGSSGDLDPHRRVARRRPRAQRLGLLHRPRRLPHRRASAAQMIGPASTAAHPRLRQPQRRRRLRQRPHLGSRRPPTARSTAASRKAGVLPVYGDRGGGDEINGKIEAGLLGIAVSPDFAHDRATSTCSTSRPSTRTTRSTRASPTATSGASRRWARRASRRFTVDLATKQLELDSEVVIFEYDSQIYSCCHRGGGMGFDSEGNLYVTTGDSNSSQRTNGYSGNYQPARCPTGPRPWPPTTTAAPTTSRSATRAARRAARNDYNGKMLRFNPSTRSPTGRSRRSASTARTRCRTRSSPNGPNLFNGTEGNGSQAKPEIYAMGLRNPSRLFDRPRDRHPVLGVGRPGRRLAVGDPGPVDVRERHPAPVGRQLRLALLHGQPAGLPRPRRRRLAAHHQRAPASSPAARPPAPRRAGTTARTSSTTRRTTPA